MSHKPHQKYVQKFTGKTYYRCLFVVDIYTRRDYNKKKKKIDQHLELKSYKQEKF